MKRSALVKHMRREGRSLRREGSRHSWWQSDKTGKRSAVPRHAEVPDQLARKNCKDLGMPIIGGGGIYASVAPLIVFPAGRRFPTELISGCCTSSTRKRVELPDVDIIMERE